jgi:hypothetical protein
MPPLRSRTVTHGRNMAGARALLPDRQRPVSAAPQVYAATATSASTGAARDISLIAHSGT